MKTLLPETSVLRSAVLYALLTFLMVMTCSVQPILAANERQGEDTIVISKLQGNKKYKIKLYPNATHEVLFFTATGEEDKVYQLFIFDVEGKLVKQTMVRNRQTGFLSRLKTGSYSYEVFSNDERIENGSVEVK